MRHFHFFPLIAFVTKINNNKKIPFTRRSDEDNYFEFFYEKKGDKPKKNDKMKTKNNKSNLIPKSTVNYR